MDFATACAEAAQMPEFVAQYNRLTDSNFSLSPTRRSVIEEMIDKVCGFEGFDKEEALKFAAFFYDFVWSTLPDNCFEEPKP